MEREPIIKRFLRKIHIDFSGCWEWQGSKSLGYGQLSSTKNHTPHKAHRLSVELLCQPIPLGLHVLHHCDNPSCVRPSHLFLGTMKDNIQDASRKGRCCLQRYPGMSLGENNNSAKLTEDQVIAIKRERDLKGMSFTELGKKHSVHRSTIANIIYGRKWKHLI